MKNQPFHRLVSAYVLIALMALPQFALAQTAPASGLINMSTRLVLDPVSNPTVSMGFYIGGTTPKRVLIRVIGPTLAAFGLTNAHPDPRLQVYSGTAVIAGNDDWDVIGDVSFGTAADKVSATVRTGAFALAPGKFDAALLITLQPGSYSVVAAPSRPERNEWGAVLCEIYEVPQ